MNEALHQLNTVSSQVLQNCPLQGFLVGEVLGTQLWLILLCLELATHTLSLPVSWPADAHTGQYFGSGDHAQEWDDSACWC